jgi:hypothetical protein
MARLGRRRRDGDNSKSRGVRRFNNANLLLKINMLLLLGLYALEFREYLGF